MSQCKEASEVRMKDSGVEWFSLVPERWNLKRLKWVLRRRKEKNSPLKTDNILSLSIAQGLVPHAEKEGVGGNKPKDDLTAYDLARPGDIVVNSMNMIVGAVGLSRYFGAISPVYYAMYPSQDTTRIDYYHYLFQSTDFQNSLAVLGNGIMVKKSDSSGKLNTIRMKISFETLGDQIIPIPEHSEQRLIAGVLDRETARIDALIEKKTRFIELLKEKRQALITQAVTKGLDTTVPMKDSGVEWIGEVPAHWEISRVKHVATIKYGIGEPPKYRDTGTPLVRATNVKQGVINHDGMVFIDPADIPKQRIVWLQPGNIVVVRSGAYTADSAIIRNLDCPSIAGFDMVVTARGVTPDFLHYALLSDYVKRDQLDQKKLRAAQPHLNAEELGDTQIVLPPLSEQKEIIGKLTLSLMKLDKLAQATVSSIGLLKERRSALITAAVTGQIDLREDAA